MTSAQNDTQGFSPRCMSLDLEVGVRDRRIRAFAALRPDTGGCLVFQGGDLAAELKKLDALAEGAAFLLGHNLIAFDLPQLEAAKPDLRLLSVPAVDTLRLNPLAFPRNPYHHLVKHYQNGQLKRGRLNNPELDARLTLDLFGDQRRALERVAREAPDLIAAWHWLTTEEGDRSGFNTFFSSLRGALRPSDAHAREAIDARLAGIVCRTHAREIPAAADCQGWALAYALAWLSVSGGNSVMPPWVRHQFPETGRIVRRLRDTACADPDCDWCRERHDARKELTRWFGFEDFRPQPLDQGTRQPMQRSIVEAAMAGKHVLGILPTGTGKSLCYQIPALSRYDKTGALTVVISPLVALMADQVAGLEAHGIVACVAINGLLSLPERADVLDRVRLGDAGILIISPEQLRNRSLRRVLDQREIGAWVLDEAHCLSKWGHDFRPDYRYVGRFIREKAGAEPVPPVLCLTATAKPDVMEDVVCHFRDELGIDLDVFDGGAQRTNLEFVVVPTTGGEKLAHLHQILMADLPPDVPGGAIVYCATRRQTEEVAEFLQEKDVSADYFHSTLSPETKKSVQQRFIEGELRIIAATNAFGMGIDKPDVRLVIHADIPGSLENYLQEAGRAGRDRDPQGRIVGARRLEERRGLRIVADFNAYVIEQLLEDLAVPGLVPALTGHVHPELPRRVRKVPEGASGSFERLQLADEDTVQTHLELHFHVGILGMQGPELGEKGIAGTEFVVDLLELRALHLFTKPGSDVLDESDHPVHVIRQQFEQAPAGRRPLEPAVARAFPFLHNWLTDAYPEATPTGTVFLTAFTTKVAVYALARGFPGTEMLVYIGAAMTCFPIFYAVIENDLRRVLAYSMINQIGFMVCGIGIGTELAVNGAVAHAFNDVIFKGLLMMSMGAVLHMTGRINGSDLGGLYKSMPITTVLCIVGAASISAFPLFSGFVSKSMVMSAALSEGYHWIWLALLFASAGVFHHAGIKIPFFAFFAHDSGIRTTEPPVNMLVAMGLAAGLCVLIGCYPRLLYDLLPFATDYTAYDTTHVLAQLQILFFSALAFAWLKLSGLYPPELPSVNIDVEWLYRKVGWRAALRVRSGARAVHAGFGSAGARLGRGIGEWARRGFGPAGPLGEAWDTSRMAIVMIGVLCVFLVSL